MATYNLVIKIDPIIVARQSGDNFNIAKKVNDAFTVTFDGASIKPIGAQKPLLEINHFKWTEEYSVFLSTSFDEGMQVSAATDPQEISFGKACEFNSGVLHEQTKADDKDFNGSDKSTTFILKSVPQSLQASVSCKSGGKWVPIYVDNKPHNGVQNKQLTPINKYAIFWDSRIVTTTMIDYSKTTNPKEFSFDAGEFTKTLRWGYQSPNNPASTTENPDWYAVKE